MNKQVSYILSASLLLLTAGCIFLFIEKISKIKPGDSTENPEQVITLTSGNKYSSAATTGKNLFMSKCASCHQVLKNATGPALAGFEERGPWKERQQLYAWIRNPAAFMAKDPYTQELKKTYGSMMTAFPDLSNEEIDAIIDYLQESGKQKNIPVALN